MDCLFCNYNRVDYIAENDLAFAIYDKFPVNKGHVLVIPKRHFQNYFDIEDDELIKRNQLIKQLVKYDG